MNEIRSSETKQIATMDANARWSKMEHLPDGVSQTRQGTTVSIYYVYVWKCGMTGSGSGSGTISNPTPTNGIRYIPYRTVHTVHTTCQVLNGGGSDSDMEGKRQETNKRHHPMVGGRKDETSDKRRDDHSHTDIEERVSQHQQGGRKTGRRQKETRHLT